MTRPLGVFIDMQGFILPASIGTPSAKGFYTSKASKISPRSDSRQRPTEPQSDQFLRFGAITRRNLLIGGGLATAAAALGLREVFSPSDGPSTSPVLQATTWEEHQIIGWVRRKFGTDTDEFLRSVSNLATKMGGNPFDFLRSTIFESQLDQNRVKPGIGLWQFTPRGLEGKGILPFLRQGELLVHPDTPNRKAELKKVQEDKKLVTMDQKELAELSAKSLRDWATDKSRPESRRLPWRFQQEIALRYFAGFADLDLNTPNAKPKAPLDSLQKVCMTVFAPAHRNSPPDTPVYQNPQEAYKRNNYQDGIKVDAKNKVIRRVPKRLVVDKETRCLVFRSFSDPKSFYDSKGKEITNIDPDRWEYSDRTPLSPSSGTPSRTGGTNSRTRRLTQKELARLAEHPAFEWVVLDSKGRLLLTKNGRLPNGKTGLRLAGGRQIPTGEKVVMDENGFFKRNLMTGELIIVKDGEASTSQGTFNVVKIQGVNWDMGGGRDVEHGRPFREPKGNITPADYLRNLQNELAYTLGKLVSKP